MIFVGTCRNVTTYTSFANIQVFNKFAEFIFICVFETKNTRL